MKCPSDVLACGQRTPILHDPREEPTECVHPQKKTPTDESQLICHGSMGIYGYSLFCTFAAGKRCFQA